MTWPTALHGTPTYAETNYNFCMYIWVREFAWGILRLYDSHCLWILLEVRHPKTLWSFGKIYSIRLSYSVHLRLHVEKNAFQLQYMGEADMGNTCNIDRSTIADMGHVRIHARASTSTIQHSHTFILHPKGVWKHRTADIYNVCSFEGAHPHSCHTFTSQAVRHHPTVAEPRSKPIGGVPTTPIQSFRAERDMVHWETTAKGPL